jgi:hypothetical protein
VLDFAACPIGSTDGRILEEKTRRRSDSHPAANAAIDSTAPGTEEIRRGLGPQGRARASGARKTDGFAPSSPAGRTGTQRTALGATAAAAKSRASRGSLEAPRAAASAARTCWGRAAAAPPAAAPASAARTGATARKG